MERIPKTIVLRQIGEPYPISPCPAATAATTTIPAAASCVDCPLCHCHAPCQICCWWRSTTTIRGHFRQQCADLGRDLTQCRVRSYSLGRFSNIPAIAAKPGVSYGLLPAPRMCLQIRHSKGFSAIRVWHNTAPGKIVLLTTVSACAQCYHSTVCYSNHRQLCVAASKGLQNRALIN